MTGADEAVSRHRLAAYAWCEDAGRVLLVRVSARAPGAGRWIVPGGGLDFGEDPAAGMLRELGEETGLAGRIDGLAGVYSRVYEPHETRSGHRVHLVAILYRATVTGGDLRDEADGTSEAAAWIPLRDLDALPSTDLLLWARGQLGR